MKRQYQGRDSGNGWCFVPPQPFKKPALLRRNQPDGIFRHVISTVGDVTTTMVKRVTGSTFSSHAGK